jgi:hypothetical protein
MSAATKSPRAPAPISGPHIATLIALALTTGAVVTARAATETAEAQSGQPTGVVPVFAFESTSCAAYPVHDVKITVQPEHGTAKLVEHATPIDKVYTHCKGKIVRMIWVVYQSQRGYRGHDSLSVSFSHGGNTLEMGDRYRSIDVAIEVK